MATQGGSEPEGAWRLSRRRFLGSVVAVALATACSGDDDDDGGGGDGEAEAGRPRAPASPGDLGGPAFTLGVASGDPLPDGVVLWTRLAPDPQAGGGMPAGPVEVAWEVAGDEDFSEVVRSGVATATPELGHSVHVEVDGLDVGRTYHYRFRLGNGETSPTGRTRTCPSEDASPERLRLGVATCQDFAGGFYAAYRHMAAEDLDAVLFLGDYIYEFGGPPADEPDPDGRQHVGPVPTSLEDYRNRHALYRSDPDLRAAHAAFPWLVVWDDHDVENNYAGDVSQRGTPPEEFTAQRAAAYQAWYEHMPMRITPPDGPDVRIYRDVAFGDLARIFLLDTRQYAPPPPCRDEVSFDAGPICAEGEDPDRTLLGPAQEEWLAEGLSGSGAAWNVLAQQVMMAGLDVSSGSVERAYYLDSWDGYPAARARLVETLAREEVANPVVLTGDYHAAFVSDVKPEPFDTGSPVVATELVTTAISSGLFGADHTAANPHVRYFEARHGYMACTIERDRLTAEFRYISEVNDPDATVETGATWVVESGTPGAREA